MLLQIKIQIKYIDHPKVWRRLLVPGQFTFFRLHKVLQVAFGWENTHLFEFRMEDNELFTPIRIPDELDEKKVRNAKKIKVSTILKEKGQSLTYLYDFGDFWEHEIVVEEVIKTIKTYADLQDGEGSCPPEDCGGPHGYQNLKQILQDPQHPEYKEYRMWLGIPPRKKFNADLFDWKTSRFRVWGI